MKLTALSRLLFSLAVFFNCGYIGEMCLPFLCFQKRLGVYPVIMSRPAVHSSEFRGQLD